MALVNPHGKQKKLMPLLLSGRELEEEKKKARTLTEVRVASREAGDLIMMGIGGFTPLTGFMGYDDWKGVCDVYKMTDGTFWPIPVTVSTSEGQANSIKNGQEILYTRADYQDDVDTIATSSIGTDRVISALCQNGIFNISSCCYPTFYFFVTFIFNSFVL